MSGTCDASPFGRHLVGDPIDVVSGANVDRARDFVLDGPFPLRWFRYCDSRWSDEDRGLGFGHRHGFDHWLVFDLDGITLRMASGQATYFPHLPHDGERQAPAGRILKRVDERTYRVFERAQPTLTFHRAPGTEEAHLAELGQCDAQGNEHRIILKYERGRLDKILAPRDETLKLEWDAGDRLAAVWRWQREGERKALIRYGYDARGCLVEGRDAYEQRFRLAYDEARRVVRRSDRRGYCFEFEYDGMGRCISSQGEDGLLAVQLSYKPLEYETRVLDANGGEWIYQYLPGGQVAFITDPYGGVRHFRIDESGKLVAEYDENGAETRYLFDSAGAPIAKVRPDGQTVALPESEDGPDPHAHRVPALPIEWELGDLWDRDFRLPDPHELPFELPGEVRAALTTSEALRRGTFEAERDEHGLKLREELEDGRARTLAYNANGNPRRWTDFDGGTYRLEHGSWNQISKETDPAGNEIGYEYTLANELSAVVDPSGVRTDYGYDLKDRLVEVRRGGPIRERYVYNAADQLIEKRAATGELLVAIERDRNGRILRRTLSSGEEYRYWHDERGRIVEARTSRHKCTFAYDGDGRCIEDKRDGSGVEHRFDGERLASTTILDRFRIEYRVQGRDIFVRDPTGRTHRIRNHGRGIFTRELADGLRETTQYHPRGGRVLSKVVWSTDGRWPAWSRTFRYGGELDLLEVRDTDRGVTRYEHDAAHRLERVRHSDGRVDLYEYNRAGSLFRSPSLDGTVGQLNQLRHANGDRLEHDDRGQVRERAGARGKWQYDRDSRDQLLVAFWEGQDGRRWGWDAEYDPLGRRIRKSPGYRDHFTYYWDTDRLAAEVLPDERLRVYVYLDAFAMVPMLFVEYRSVDGEPSSGTPYYVFTDQRGCPERIVDGGGAIVWKARIDPYGWAHVEVGADLYQPLRFPGHFWDVELGLHYNRFRYYSPELGRYLESDPWGLAGGLNLYVYTSNPLTRVDVRGLNDCDGQRVAPHPPPSGPDSEAVAVHPTVIVGDPPPAPHASAGEPPVVTGLGAHIDDIVNRSPTLRRQIGELEATGWRIHTGPADGGSYADRDSQTIVIEGGMSSGATASTLAHEVGHAQYGRVPHQPAQPGDDRAAYVNRNVDAAMHDEGSAQFNATVARDEILSSGGPDIGTPGNGDYISTYDQYKAGALTRDEAVNEMAQTMGGEVASTTNQSYRDYYGEPYADGWDKWVASGGGGP